MSKTIKHTLAIALLASLFAVFTIAPPVFARISNPGGGGSSSSSTAWGDITGTLTSQSDLASALNLKLASSSLQTSALLYGLLSDETGSGTGALAVFSIGPTFTGKTTLAAASTTNTTVTQLLQGDGSNKFATSTVGNSGVAAASSTAITDRNRTFYVDGSVAVKECTLTDGATVTWDLSQCSYARIVQGGNRTLDITNQGQAIGQSVRLVVCSDGTGRTLTWDTAVIMWPGGTPPTQTATANQCDVVAGFVTAATGTAKIFLGSSLAF